MMKEVMKITIKKTTFACILLCIPIVMISLHQTHQRKRGSHMTKKMKQEFTMHETTQQVLNCSFLLSQSPDETLRILGGYSTSEEEFKKIINKYTTTCLTTATVQNNTSEKEVKRKKKAPKKMGKVTPVAFENHLLVHSPRKDVENESRSQSYLPFCPPVSPLLKGHIDVNLLNEPELKNENGKFFNWPLTLEEISEVYPDLRLGGFYPGPKYCKCRSFNAIIVPYRDREEHLRYFLYYIHQILQRQQHCYVVIVAEQDNDDVFNKGQLMNTAFRYAVDAAKFDCFIFHDVDIIAEDDRIIYGCRSNLVTHLAPYIDKFGYKSISSITVGAAIGFTAEQYWKVNGYSNEFTGWGGEDDDMMERIRVKKLQIWRSSQMYTRFKMIKHGRDMGNNINNQRFQRLSLSSNRVSIDGVSSLDTSISKVLFYKTHVRLKINTYKTAIEAELIKKAKLKTEKMKQAKLLASGPGIPIQEAGRVIRAKTKIT